MEKKVMVYSTVTCPHCHMAKKYLDEKNIQYESIDVGADRDAAMALVERTGQMAVPVIEIGDELIVGFQKDKINAALGL